MSITLPGLAFAHAKITATVPADGDFVRAPEELVLTFDNAVQLTGVELKTAEGDTRDVGDVSTERAKTFIVSVPQTLPPGEYYLIWRCIASDSHFSTGEFFFTVTAD
jgi:methionine-rich copper-binding protein CopC